MRPHKPDYVFLSFLAVLLIFGLLMLASASSAEGYVKFKDTYFFIKRQLLFGVLPGLIIFFLISRIDYHFWLRWSKPLFYFSLLLLALVLIPDISAVPTAARSWLFLQGLSFQPAELAKLSLILYLSSWLYPNKFCQTHLPKWVTMKGAKFEGVYRMEREGLHWTRQLIPLIVILAIISLLLLKQPDFGTLMILVMIILAVYFVGGGRLWHLAGLLGAGILGMVFLIFSGSYHRLLERFTVFLNPAFDPQGLGYQINQALLAIGSGGFWGLGWGHSRQKFQYLPEVRSDSIFAVIGEELGFLLSAAFILFLGLIFWRGLKIAQRAPDKFGKLIVSGVMIWLVGQSFVNISSMIGLLPLTGLPLPLVSHGGSAMIMMLAALGIVVNVSRQTKDI